MSQKPRTVFRELHGLLLLDKPQGLSSNQALQRARHLFRAEKAGHTGSLDPLATGLLPICFGEATKIAGGLLGARKAYETVARLGIVTDTDDAEGQPLRERPVPELTIPRIDAALQQLTGCIRQRPPIYSALKRGGEPLYAKARRGETVEIDEREVDVHAFDLLNAADLLHGGEPLLRLHVECGSGTYVRSLVRDLGELLGCGAHVAELRRLWVDPFREPRMWTLEALQDLAERAGERVLDACLLPIEAGMTAWPEVQVTPAQAQRLGQGQSLTGDFRPTGSVALFDGSGRALGLGEVDEEGRLRPQRLFTWAAALGQPAPESAKPLS
ncbi:tRNA pseudouridine(55) synthase TruB [Lysobacter sp. CFH 32150]|uniref:tRNA pseudouridine(55) synthase TruB n=1 Tax=Lysobacter sp. CFH 32150 TaxID=2927128 RepID=UPI001FA703C1|nr:tRNA pseudouridine(55) synthase TruB [Lysobacter sp. CFH 32150]MCI4567234.1 tRNA pseudouridine(55) synthase TruB [Lysobacter sp. CFH 32150]